MRGVILDSGSFDQNDLKTSSLEESLENWNWHRSTLPNQTMARIAGMNVIVTNKVVINASALASSSLQLIVVAATGTNNIDLEEAARKAISVCNVRDYAAPAVSQHVFSMMLSLHTRLADYANAVREGRWHQSPVFCLLDYPINELAGKTLGIIGYGNLGKRVARIAQGFDMKVVIAARPGTTTIPPGRVSFDELIDTSDVISLHCPLNDDTNNLIDRHELKRMKSGAILINTARGGIVNESALVEALRAGEIAGAGIDVLTQEPPDNCQPLMSGDIPNLIVSPHNAWGSIQARQRLVDEVTDLIKAFRNGQAQNLCLPD
ncbi:D-2-hydroxyacid dehydrogenase [Arenicellales bacterium nBUS_48]